jgi:DNA primase
MSLSPAFLDELRSRTSLSRLIEQSVKLTKAGSEKRGCCPFHNEKSPSFYVNDDKGFYHCFGCSAHGDAIRWMTDQRGLQFIDAVKELAAAAGMQMPDRDPQHAERDREQQAMFDIMDHATRYFALNMEMAGAQSAAWRYLDNRGVTARAIFDFDIGLATRDAEPLHRHLKDVAPEMLVKLGLAKIHDEGDRKGEVFDFFRGRIMFPIRDQRGRVIGFGGRVLGDQQPKYLNSPDTPIFDKGRTLYNIDRAGPAAKAAKRVLVVEGYMDVIGLASAGVNETVAPNGTALTEAQITRLWTLSDTPILCFDGDKAGKAAAARAAIRALPLLEPDRSLSFITPPNGKDPDDIARSGGAEAVEAMLASPKPLVDVIWEHECAAGPTDTPEQRAGLASRLRERAASIRNRGVAQAYYDEFKARFEAKPKVIYVAEPRRAPMQRQSTERQPFIRREKPQTDASKAIARKGVGMALERAIIAGLMRYPSVVSSEMDIVCSMTIAEDSMRELRDVLMDAAISGKPFVVPDHLEGAARAANVTPLRFSFNRDGADPAQAMRNLTDALYQLRR